MFKERVAIQMMNSFASSYKHEIDSLGCGKVVTLRLIDGGYIAAFITDQATPASEFPESLLSYGFYQVVGDLVVRCMDCILLTTLEGIDASDYPIFEIEVQTK